MCRAPSTVRGGADPAGHQTPGEGVPTAPRGRALERLSRVDTYKRTEYAILKTATEHLERGQTVMFLAACSYMVAPLVMVLREHGIPFHNPYRVSNGFWNPLRLGKPTSTPNRILALLIGHPDYGEGHRAWAHGDLAAWADLIAAKGVLRHGMKAKIKAGDVAGDVTMAHLASLFEADALRRHDGGVGRRPSRAARMVAVQAYRRGTEARHVSG